MKRIVLLTAVVLCLLVAGCGESNLSVYGNPDADGAFGLRAGTNVAKNLEVGASAYYVPGSDAKDVLVWSGKHWKRKGRIVHIDKVPDWNYGAHVILHLPNDSDIEPYVGAQSNIGDGSWDLLKTIQPIGGLNLKVTESISTFAEYQQEALNGEDKKVLFGIRLRF